MRPGGAIRRARTRTTRSRFAGSRDSASIRNCIRGLGEVFDPGARPWVRVDAADAARIAKTILTCPTGALHFRRLDGDPQEQPPSETSIEPRRNGPLFVRGRVRIVDGDGAVVGEDTRVALCRCGGSRNKPFCDGTHREIQFTSEEKK
jgi:CDGSH-type Zn-finger protein/uncharacterized Fe-S cluster protein YjdI